MLTAAPSVRAVLGAGGPEKIEGSEASGTGAGGGDARTEGVEA